MPGPPRDDESWLLWLGALVSDGKDVDWADAEARATDDSQRRIVQEMRRIASVIRAHESLQADDPPDASPQEPRHWRHLLLFECLGSGAFGRVYRAWDPQLDREVAVKLVETSGTRTASPLAEARHLARLRHAHVVTVYGADVDAEHAGIWMEYLKGETLGEIVRARGPMSARETIGIGLDLCGALSAIHRAGLFHRDIKPDNVMRETGGRIVLMDFSGAQPAQRGEEPALLTGTPLYMAPELLEGGPPSPQTDVYSLGVLLFYLLSGRLPLEGTTAAELRDAHARNDRQRLRDVRPDLPEGILQAIDRATAPDVSRRFGTPGELREALAYATPQLGDETQASRTARRGTDRQGLWWAAAAVLVALATLGALWRRPEPPAPAPVTRFTIGPPFLDGSWPRLSRDGRLVVFGTMVQGRRRFWIRPLESTEGRALMETTATETPFWSPDSRRLAFFERGKLKVISAEGGSPQTLTDAPTPHGGDWFGSTILYARAEGIYRVDAEAGGAPVQLTHVDDTAGEFQHGWPQFLSDGRRYLYVVRSTSPARAGLYLGSLDGTPPRRLMDAESRTAYANGYLFYVRSGALVAQPFDERTLTLGTGAVVLAPRVQAHVSNDAAFDVSRTGVLIYSSPSELTQTKLIVTDRTGRELMALTPAGVHSHPRFSPDGSRVVAERVAAGEMAPDLWIYGINPRVASRLTRNPAPDVSPLWSPDGQSIVFSSRRGNTYDIYEKTVDGVGDERVLLSTSDDKYSDGWSADGRHLITTVLRSGLWVLPLNPPGAGVQVRATSGGQRWAAEISRDGRWIAYASLEDGQSEVFVEPFPGTGSRWQVSERGGGEPHWDPDGSGLVYLDPEGVLVSVTPTGADWRRPSTRPLFKTNVHDPTNGNSFDLSPDGRTVVLNAFVSEPPGVPVVVVLNWPTLVAQRH